MSGKTFSTRNGRSLTWMDVAGEEIQAVEQRLWELIFSKVPTVFRLSEHLLSAGGKRLRPALVALSARAAGNHYELERVITVGAASELIHMATLVHDDVIDQTGVRRGRATANSFWGNKVSVLSGDHMLSKAFWLLSCDGDTGILKAISSMTVAMSESEVLQAVCEGSVDGWKEHYLDIVRGKTAGFFASCCKSGGIIGGAGTEAQDALYEYGMQLGVAFQITDDLLDIAGSPSATGKPLGSDIREGKFTLPLLLVLDNLKETARGSLLEVLGRNDLSEDDIAFVCEAAGDSGAVKKATEIAATYAEKAVAALAALPLGDARMSLESLAGGIVCRRS